MRRPEWTGLMAWRNGFSLEAADLLAIYSWTNCKDETHFQHLLIECARLSRGHKTNIRTVEKVLAADPAYKVVES